MTQNYFSFHSKSPSSYRSSNRPLTALSFMQNGDSKLSHSRSFKRLKSSNSPKIKTIQYIRSNDIQQQQNQSTLLKLFDAKCLDSKIAYTSEKALIFLNRFATTNKRKLKLNGMDLGYNTMKIICDLLKNNHYYHLDLEKNKLGDASILKLSQLLSQSKTIVYLNLGSNGIKEIGSEHLFESLQHNTSLTHLQLGSKNGFNKNSIKSGTKALCESLKQNNTLIYLGLAYTQIGLLTLINLYQGLKVNTSLLDLNLASNDLGQNSMDYIIKILRYHDLHTLNLSHNQFGNDATKELFSFFNAYNRNLKLRHLIYNDNNINHKTAYYMFQALRSNISIQKLFLNQNNFTQQINSLTYCLQQNSILQILSFQNCGANANFVKCISTGLIKNKGLKTLILNNNKIGNEGSQATFKFLQTNQHLIRLQLKKCQLGDEAINSFSEYIKKNRCLQTIILSDNYINDQGGKKILDSIQHNTIIKELLLDSNLLGFRILGYINMKLKINKDNFQNDKFPIKRDQLRILQNQVREQQITLGFDKSQMVDKKTILQDQVRQLRKRLKQKLQQSQSHSNHRQKQIKNLDKQLKILQKTVFEKKQIQLIRQQIIDTKEQILIERQALVELERKCLGMVKKTTPVPTKKATKRAMKSKPFAV